MLRIVIGLSLGAWSVGASSASCGGAHECSADVDFEGLSALQTASVRDSGDDAPTPAPTPSPTPSSTPARCRPARYCSEMCEALECEKSRLECEKYCRLRFDKFLDIMKRYKKYGVCEDDPVSSLAQVGAEEAADAKLEEKVERSASGEADPAVECKEVAYYCLRFCSSFDYLDWPHNKDCQKRCSEHFRTFRGIWDFYVENGVC
mmetsp:Transcript_3207/g.7291  ORF Transcript_3207/g.7291 Transcript_3207/m.7291 type:complete len:205 (+) Transcript_3207:87-701(+)